MDWVIAHCSNNLIKDSFLGLIAEKERLAFSCILSLDLSRFDAAPLIAFTATKEIDYGTETDG